MRCEGPPRGILALAPTEPLCDAGGLTAFPYFCYYYSRWVAGKIHLSKHTRGITTDAIPFIYTPVDSDEESKCQLDFFSRQNTEALTVDQFRMFV